MTGDDRNSPWFFVLNERARILVVDDDLILAEFAKVHLATPVTEVESVSNGAAAWDRLCAESFDLVLADIEMPVLDGFALLTKLRADPRFEHLPVIMLTGREDIASIDRAFELGATAFVTKPVNWRQLSYELRYVLRSCQREAELRRERDRADELSRLASNVLSLLRREIRTPLNSIIGFSDIIEQQIDGPISIPSYLEYAEQIGVAAHQLHDKFLHLIQYVQLCSGEAKLTDDEYSVEKIVDAAIAAVSFAAVQSSIAVENRISSDGLYVRCDFEWLTRALRGLLENAFARDGDHPIEFVVDRASSGDLVFSIVDRGARVQGGDQAAETKALWSKTSLDPTRQEPGIGISLVRRIAELHEGKLVVRANGDVGAISEITLPGSRVIERDACPAPSRHAEGSQTIEWTKDRHDTPIC